MRVFLAFDGSCEAFDVAPEQTTRAVKQMVKPRGAGPVSIMRVFVAFDGSCEAFDVAPEQTTRAVKQMVKEHFHVRLSDDTQARHFLELSYAGATLQDGWTLSDVGVTPGSAIRCLIKTEQKPVLCVFNAVTGQTVPIMGGSSGVFPLRSSVARLRSLVSRRCALPVGAFRLSTLRGVQLYDCNRLHDYPVDVGATLRLDTWDGWAEFLRGCFQGHKLTVQRNLSEERQVMRFQLRVALYVAASLGHLDLAGWALERGARSEDPVGVHPYRRWCRQTAHPDAAKCPVHAASERGRLLLLKLFVSRSAPALACRDPRGRDPLRIAVAHGHGECARHLGARLCSSVSLPGAVLPMRVYLQMKRWAGLGQRRARARRSQGHGGAPPRARVGDTVLVDGFTLPKMSSKPRGRKGQAGREVRPKAHRYLTTDSCPPPVHHPHPKPASQGASLQLPKLRSGDAKAKRTRMKEGVCGGKGEDDSLLADEVTDESPWRSRVPLPPISRDVSPRPPFISASPGSAHILAGSLESFSRRCGRTPRENAIYCLAMASAFTERPWLQQLDVARTLARRSVLDMG